MLWGNWNIEKKKSSVLNYCTHSQQETLCTNPEVLNSQEKEFCADKNANVYR